MSLSNTAADDGLQRRGIPRPIEAGLVAVALVICSPLLAAVGLAVRATSAGPALLRQRRVGLGGAEFTLVKFRTMRVNLDAPGATASGDTRITRLGRWLRLLKLDELPELWNVLRGEMALVGPRPEVPGYVDLSDPAWRAVLCVRPGITDPVTLRLRNEEHLLLSAPGTPEAFYRQVLQPYKLAGYLEYQQRRSFASDIGVILRTLGAVLVPAAAPPPSIDAIRAAIASPPPAAATSAGPEPSVAQAPHPRG